MGKVKVVLNKGQVKSFLKNETLPMLQEAANLVKDRAGEGFDTYIGKNRANISVLVYAKTDEAEKNNLQKNSLLRAMNGGKRS